MSRESAKSKKVKKDNAKLIKTDSQVAALEHIAKKKASSEIPIIGQKKEVDAETLMKEIRNQEGAFDAKKDEGIQKTDKILTEADIEAEIQEQEAKAEAEAKRYREEFNKQLKEFASHLDEQADYEALDFKDDGYLVRMFVMDISSFEGYYERELYVAALQGGRIAEREKKATQNLHPIAKIIRVGEKVESDEYKEGDIVLVPSKDVYGEQLSQEFQLLMQNQRSMGMQPVLPEGYRQFVPNIEVYWRDYNFVRPWVQTPEDIDHITFFVPIHRFRGKCDVSKLS